MLPFALTIFTGAFLLFLVQPLIGKYILPWFGGSPAVWTTCMLFFQVMLLGGYAYAHWSVRLAKPRIQALMHGILLLAALIVLPIIPSAEWKPLSTTDPVWRILLLLTACVGLPYFVLSTTGPLMQEWFRRLNPGASPYRLYALSNLGSLLALLGYPFAMEPLLTRKSQAAFWSWGLGIFSILCAWCAWRLWKSHPMEAPAAPAVIDEQSEGPDEKPSPGTKLLWLLLPACASVLLLAITNKFCQDVAVIPFLWVLPLGLYLATFIICFDSPGLYSRSFYSVALFAAMGVACFMLFEGSRVPILVQIGIYCVVLFFGCMVMHGEVYRLKPHPRHLTGYYLALAAGGAAGGLFVALAAPLLFRSFVELHWGLWSCAFLIFVLYWRDGSALTIGRHPFRIWVIVLLGTLLLGMGLTMHVAHDSWRTLEVRRNFYGVLRVCKEDNNDPATPAHVLKYGDIIHGIQLQSPGKTMVPTTYYNEESGVGVAMLNLHRPQGRRMGLVGLGTGTLAVYGKTNDYIRYYEINPEVKRLAESHFSFLSQCKARVDVILGDARLSLESEPPQQFDMLVLDAFSGDAIPVHLLTREAMQVYDRHLKPDGVLAIHISNAHLNLRPVVEKLAAEFQMKHALISYRKRTATWWNIPSDWMLLTRDQQFLGLEAVRLAQGQPPASSTSAPLWTDEYTSLFKILK